MGGQKLAARTAAANQDDHSVRRLTLHVNIKLAKQIPTTKAPRHQGIQRETLDISFFLRRHVEILPFRRFMQPTLCRRQERGRKQKLIRVAVSLVSWCLGG
jgi:hypothetical protein